MEYKVFERIMSKKRMNRYLTACGGDTRKAMTLYRYNLHLTQDVFTVISCFEVALRNAIDARLVPMFFCSYYIIYYLCGRLTDYRNFL